jgi:uncharacterized protein YdaU (DUF1376 family)
MTPNKKAVQAGTRTASNAAIDGRNSSKKIKQPFWLPINTESYRAETADLSTLEHGAFLLLRLHYWRTGPLENNDKRLARISGLTVPEWKEVRRSLERFFDIDTEWINWEWDGELAKAFAYIQKASDAGKVGADNRWRMERERKARESESDTNRMRGASEPDTNRYANYKSGGKPPETPCLASGEIEDLPTKLLLPAGENPAPDFPGDSSLGSGVPAFPVSAG